MPFQRIPDHHQQIGNDSVLAVVDALHPESYQDIDSRTVETLDYYIVATFDRNAVTADDLRKDCAHVPKNRDHLF